MRMWGGRVPDGGVPDGRVPDGMIPGGRASDGPIPGGRVSDGRVPGRTAHGGPRGWFERLRDSLRWRDGGALLAGALPALAFPAPSLGWFAYVALVPWLLLIRSADTDRRAAIDGWLGGMGFMLAVHHWLVPSLHVFIVVLAAAFGLLWAPWGVLVGRLLGGAPSVLRSLVGIAVLPSGWLMIELVRSWEGLGGPWGLLGASQWEFSPALRAASVGGVWLVSLLVLAVNTVVALLIVGAAARTAAVVSLAGCTLAVAAMWAWAPQPEPAGRARIAVVQPGMVDGPGSITRRLARSEELTRSLAGQDIDLVVWGESSLAVDLAHSPETADRIADLSRLVGAYVLVNMDARQTDAAGRAGIFKSAVLVGSDGPTGDRYDKMRLVPFGEYIPARSVLGWATSVGKAAGEDRLRGSRPVVMDLPGEQGLRLGPLVCFESAFPDMSRQLARDGAQLLVIQSSTSTFQNGWAPAQHASLAALRAAETGRPAVHATLTGISAVFGPGGEPVGKRLGTDASAAAVFDVPLAQGTTLYVRLGDWPVHGAVAVLVVLGAVEGLRRLRRPARARPVPLARTVHESPGRPAR